MRRKFVMTDIVEIMEHWYAGRSKEEVARRLDIDSKAVRKYMRAAVAEGIFPGGRPLSEEEWRAKIRGWFPSAPTTPSRSSSAWCPRR